jgi:H+/Cl- antiporter ClcA
MTNQQAFLLISGIIFGLVALMHAVRLALRWQVKVNQREVPMGLSVGGLIVAAGLSFWALWLLL